MILYRGEKFDFDLEFFEDINRTRPLKPVNPTKYPEYAIYDTDGSVVQNGVATQTHGPGYYRITYMPTSTAKLTASDTRYRLDVLMVTKNRRQVTQQKEFEVKEPALVDENEFEQQYVVLAGETFDAKVYFDKPALTLSAKLINALTGATTATFSLERDQIKASRIEDMYLYVVRIGSANFAANGDYIMLWNVTFSQLDTPDNVYQRIRCISPVLLAHMNSVRTLIDRFHKTVKTPQAYLDSHLVEFLDRGRDMVNAYLPFTSYAITNIPDPLRTQWYAASSYWGLMSQYGVETDMSFNFSGQTVSLDYDRTGLIESQLSRIKEWIDDSVPKVKADMQHRAPNSALLITRPPSYRYMMRNVRIGGPSGAYAGPKVSWGILFSLFGGGV